MNPAPQRPNLLTRLPPATAAAAAGLLCALVTLVVWQAFQADQQRVREQRFQAEANRVTDSFVRETQRLEQTVQFSRLLLERWPNRLDGVARTLNEFRVSLKSGAALSIGWLDVRVTQAGGGAATAQVVNYSTWLLGFGTNPTVSLAEIPGAAEAITRAIHSGQLHSVPIPVRLPHTDGPTHLVVRLTERNPEAVWQPGQPWPEDGFRVLAVIVQEKLLWQQVQALASPAPMRITPRAQWADPPPVEATFCRVVDEERAGIRWRFAVTPAPEFFAADASTPAIALAGGAVLSLLLTTLVFVQARARQTAERAQAEISRANDALEHRIHERTADLQSANAALSRFKSVADNTSDLVGMATIEGTPLYLNSAGRALLGIPADTDVATLPFTSIYTPAAMELFERVGFPQAFTHGHWSGELSLRHCDGREIPVSFVGLVVKSPEGRPQYFGCVARDLRARVELEQQLRAAFHRERGLHQLKSHFVNTISHEFRTPLGLILFAASMLESLDAELGPDQRAEQLRAIHEAVARMNELVEQSLSLGRAEVAEPRVAAVDLAALCRRVADEVLSAQAHRCPVNLRAGPLPTEAWTDEVMLRTILTNLLGNAVKYSPAGSPVELEVRRVEAEAVFTVRDRGPGLHAEDLPHLFASFRRGAGTEGIPGTGLGLAIVKRCAEALGGTVTGANAPEGGAVFTVRLPLFNPPATSAPTA